MSATSAPDAVRRALVALLGARIEFATVDGRVHRTAPTTLPQVTVDDPQASDWGTKSDRGRELRTAISIRVAQGQRPRLAAMVAGAESAGEALAGDIGGWRVASAVLVRSRSFDASDGTRAALVEHRIRVLEI